MANTGRKNPTATGEDFNQWANPANGYTSNNSYATEDTSGEQQDYYNFEFPDLSAAPSVDGIIVRIEAKRGAADVSGDIDVALSFDGGTTWTSAKNTGALTNKDVVKTLGGTADDWDRTWSGDEFTNANFRLRITAKNVDTLLYVDAIDVDVYYTAAAVGGTKISLLGAGTA